MQYDKDVTITDEELECLKGAVVESLPLGAKTLIFGREIPEDMRLPNGMNYEQFKQRLQEDVDKTLGTIKSACEKQATPGIDLKFIDQILGRMRTAVLNEVGLREIFWTMAKAGDQVKEW